MEKIIIESYLLVVMSHFVTAVALQKLPLVQIYC